jgi:hypothetical protein
MFLLQIEWLFEKKNLAKILKNPKIKKLKKINGFLSMVQVGSQKYIWMLLAKFG